MTTKRKGSYKGMSKPREFSDYLSTLDDRLNRKLHGGKIRSRLIRKNKKTAIPGFGYWFKK
jgi:hypothetical protein